jgi:hypothetical protein
MSEALSRLQRLMAETPSSFKAEASHLHALVWAMSQLDLKEYCDQDIITRLHQAQWVMETNKTDPIVWRDKGVGLCVTDVINNAIMAIKRLQKETLK